MQRKWPACGRTLEACRVTKIAGGYPSARALLQIYDRRMLEASPDLRLPSTIEAFNSALEAGLAWRSKYGGDVKQQACTHDTTDNVRELMRPLKDRGIVELGIGGKTKLPPSTQKQLDNVGGSDRQPWPAGCECSLNGDAVEHRELDSPSQDQAFNGIERIEFASARRNLRQVPTDRRRRSAGAAPSVQNASALQDATDGPPRRDLRELLLDHRSADGIRTGVSQIARGQFAAQPQNNCFGIKARSIDGPWCARWLVAPVDTIKPLSGCAFDPSLHGLKTHAKLAGNTAHRFASPNSLDHRTTLLFDEVLDSRAVSLFPSAYQPDNHPPGHRAMEAARLWKARPKARPSHSLWKTPHAHRPRFPQLPQPLLATRKRFTRQNKTKHISTNRVTWGCWHLSDLGLVALGP